MGYAKPRIESLLPVDAQKKEQSIASVEGERDFAHQRT